MTNNVQLNTHVRTDMGKGASRRLRRDNKIPAVIYGGGKDPIALTLNHNEIIKALEDNEFYSQILTINVDDKPEQVILKDIQRHLYKPKVMHVEFMRIKANESIIMSIPLHFIGEDDSPGIKQGGKIHHALSEVEIKCLPVNLPKYIEVDISTMELNDNIHLSDLKLPKKVELTALTQDESHSQLVASLQIARMAEESVTATEEAEEAPDEETTTE